MNKTVSINLGGQVFQIDELAYERLWQYLEAIKIKYANAQSGADIITDIESRLAEMFYEAMGNLRQVITMADVEQVITVMGQPDQFEAPLEDEEEPIKNTKATAGPKAPRRLFRNPDDKVVGGIASGLSLYLGIHDPIWMRIIFLIALFGSFGTVFIIYIILLVIVPEAKTASEKLQMRGEPITLESIEKTVHEELNDLEKRINSANTGDKARSAAAKFADVMATVLKLFFRILGKVIGAFFIILSIALLISLFLGISIPALVEGGLAFDLLPYVFTTSVTTIAAIVGFGLLFLIPCLFLLYAGISILLNRRVGFKGIGLTIAGLLLVSIILVIYSVANVNRNNDVTRSQTERIVLAPPVDGVLRIEQSSHPRNKDNFKQLFGFGSFREENDSLYVKENITLNVVKATGDEYILVKTTSAGGQDGDMAFERSQNISYNLAQGDANLYLPLYFSFPVADRIRGQEIELVLYVPEGGSVYLNKNIRSLIYDIKNVTNTYDGKMVGHTWKMLPDGLTCTDCGDAITTTTGVNHTLSMPSPPADGIEMPLDDFTKIDVSGSVDFYLIPNANPRIVFEDKKDKEDLTVEVSGGELSVSNTKFFNFKNREITVWVYTPIIENITISGASDGKVGTFKADNLRVELSGASDCLLNVEASKLKLHISGASKLEAMGSTATLDAEATGASKLDAFKLTADMAKVHASGASSANVYVVTELDAESSGASSISYKGSPRLSSSSSGSSSIKAKP